MSSHTLLRHRPTPDLGLRHRTVDAVSSGFRGLPRNLGRPLGWTRGWLRPSSTLAATLFLLVRLANLVLLTLIVRNRHSGRYSGTPLFLDPLRDWDYGWFMTVAQHGYPSTLVPGAQVVDPHAIAFFPGYPGAIWLVSKVLRMQSGYAALLVSAVAGTVAAVALYQLVRDLYGPRVGLVSVLLWSAQPMGIVLSAGYSEALFCAFAFTALRATQRRQWWAAGVLAFLAGTVRCQGLAVAGTVVACALLAWWRDGHEPRRLAGTLGPAAFSLAAVPGYILLIGLRVGDLGGWFRMEQDGWHSGWDGGRTTLRQIWDTAAASPDFFMGVVVVLGVIAVMLYGFALAERLWFGLLVYGGLSLIQLYGSTVMAQSRPRLLVPVVTLVVPLALVICRARPVSRVLVLVPLVLFGLWYGAYALSVWQLGI